MATAHLSMIPKAFTPVKLALAHFFRVDKRTLFLHILLSLGNVLAESLAAVLFPNMVVVYTSQLYVVFGIKSRNVASSRVISLDVSTKLESSSCCAQRMM